MVGNDTLQSKTTVANLIVVLNFKALGVFCYVKNIPSTFLTSEFQFVTEKNLKNLQTLYNL